MKREKFEVTVKKFGTSGVIDITNPDELLFPTKTETQAKILCEYLNDMQHKINEKPLNLHEDFKEYDEIIERLDKSSRRLLKIEKTYQMESDRILTEARETEVDFKEIYGANNKDVRKQYVDEQLTDLLDEKEELEFIKSNDNRRIGFIKRMIDMKIELLKLGV